MKLESIAKTAQEVSLDSITKILAELEALSEEDAQQLLANAMHFKQKLQQQGSDFSTNVLQSQLDYWKQRLSGSLPVLELPTDRPRPPIQTFRNARQTVVLPKTLTQSLERLSRQEKVTLFMTLLAAFQTLLHRYTGQEEILVGSGIANRNSVESKGLKGFFVNTLVMRTTLSGDPTFQELLAQVREVALGAYAHQDVPIEKLVEELQLERDSSRNPLFQVMFALQNAPMPLEMASLMPSPVDIDNGTSKFDLLLEMEDTEQGLVGVWEYNTDLFDATTITRMAGNFQTLLQGIVAQPEQRISQLPLLSAAERQTLLVEWNQTQTSYPQHVCVHELFEATVERTPDAIAVVFENQQLTYRELNSRANCLAHYLKTLGVGPDVLVGICVERSLEMMIGLLGILKAGGAYVPLDPAYPQERLNFILADAQATVLLSQQHLAERLLSRNANAKVVLLDTDWETIAQARSDNLVSGVTDDNLAYVIYTSGSTGKPKGTLIAHRGLVNYLIWCTQAYAVAEGEGAPVHSSISFDLTITGLFSPLLVGQRVEMLPETMGIEALSVALRHGSNFSLVKITPAQLDLLRHQLSPQEAAGRTKAFIIGGENLSAQSLAFWQEFAPDTILVNEYGPTETVVGCCIYQVPIGKHQSGSIPIGRPIANTQLYILDRHLQPQPIGVVGELYIGGAGVARGYMNRPELTAEKFIPNPFSNEKKVRLYKTGDLARYQPDGTIEFLGRSDHQVKLRGFRIELEEIEALLSQHSAVRETVVIAREDVPGDKRLVAYVVPVAGQTPNRMNLRRFLQTKLPEYMVPSAFVFLEVLPLTHNGKVDRRALPAPDAVALASEETYLAPRTPTEEALALLWAQVLRLQQLGIHDNFFELGGHSLLATQLVSRIRQAFQVELPLSQLFELPTVGGLAQRIETAVRTEQGLQILPIQPATYQGDMLLSFAQQRLWFLEQIQAGNAAYNIYAVLGCIGSLNVAALEQSFNEICKRHAALRTTFSTSAGQPIQVISPPRSLLLPIVDLGDIPVVERELIALRKASEVAQQPFDLVQGPLFQAQLLRLSQDNHLLVLTMHHIVSDGWSMGVLVQELVALYEAFSQGQPSPLPQLPIQYADFAHWQRQWLQGEVLQSQLTYWQQQLQGAQTILELPTDRPRPPVQTFRGAQHTLVLPLSLTEALKRLSRKLGVTLFMTLLAAFQALLYRYTRQEDILVGSPIANRNFVELEGLIGFFVNTLVMRTSFSGNPTFEELLAQVREVALGAYAHQDVPIEKLVEELQPERELSRSPLFQVMFVLQNAPMPALELASVTVSPLNIDNGTSKFDLLLNLSECSEGLSGWFEYNTDLFDAATIARMAGHFQTLLEGIVAHPQQRVTELPILSATERHQLLVSWNDTSAEYSQNVCIHQLFEAQVERKPTAIAVVFENQQLTYQELNCQANKIAHHLKSLGVGLGNTVAVYMDRSLEMIPALLGILKAGGAYVPLETSFPKARIGWILSSLDVRTVITQQSHLQTFDELQPQLPALEHLICLDEEVWQRSHLCQQPEENLPLQSSPDDTAYIIFTSGSTGTPKGVVVRHKPAINLIEWVNKTFNVNASDRVLFITSLCFDLSVYDIFGLLAAGGSIRVVSSQDVRDPEALLHILCNEPITFWDSAPPALQQLVPFFPDVKSRLGQQQLRLVFMSGDWVPVTLPDLVKATFPGVQVISLGGATEATVWSNFYPIGEVDPNWVSIPYGKPIQNAQYYILDSHGNPCPIGVPGELYIGGKCLASGYTDPAKTAERFIPNPFSQAQNARLYRTGDLARYLPDGNIQFLGRIDHQVKIRGFRIELGEIEATLGQHPAVRQSMVLARVLEPGNKYLVAYIELEQGKFLTTSQVRSFVKEKLPEYMVPSAFVFLEALPITSNGKVDRRALPAPDIVKQSPENTYLAPQNPVEEMLALIWAEVLKLQQVGVQDNFFELGGHSLLATQLVSRVREAFQVELPVRQLFELPTVASLAQRIETNRRAKQNLQVPPIQPITHQEPIPASFAQQRLWVLDQLFSGNAAYNIPIVLRVLGPLNVVALEQSFNEICKRHAALRTTFSTTAGQPLQVISPPHPRSMPVVDLSNIPAVERESVALRLAREAAQQPFDLVQGPLVRIKVLRLSAENHLLLLTMHHIISDGWSIGVLVRELATLYEACSKGQPSPLLKLPIQYADFAHWQRQWLQGDVLQPQLDYWKQRLSGNLPVLELPTDRPRPPIQTFPGARQSVVLPPPLTQSLKRLSQQQGVTLFMTLLAAFQTLLYRYTGQEDILVGSGIANRNYVEIEALIGCFVNTLVMRTNLSGNSTFQELLAQVREVALGAYAHQDVPFEKLVEELQPERDSSRSPLFQVMFILQNAPMPALEMADLTLSPLDIDNGTSKFDLLLSMEDTQQGLVGVWEYNTDLFDATTITRMTGHFQTLLEGIIAHPEQRVSHLPILSAAERHQLFVEWNGTIAEYPQNLCIHQLFEATVERSPDKVAVVFENQQLTYGELNQRANYLAGYLKKCGVGSEDFVGICVERSPLMVVGVLAILKAGGTYVPLDPRYPKDRIAFVLEDTTAPVLLTQASLVASLPANSAKIVCLDTDWEIIAQEDKENLRSEVNSENLAYTIYTSGSTGKPKGVQIPHRAAVNFLTSMSLTPGLTAQDILLSVTTISFDIAALEIFLPLTVGAQVVVANSEVASDGYALQELLRNSGATVMQATPATWRLLLEAGWSGCTNLKILCGGEAMPRALASQLLERVGSLWNMYGPTETTIWSTVYQVEKGSELISIGRPIANTQIYLLDSCGQPVPVGVPGELHIGGVGLAKGYLNRPELTAEKFIAHPYSNQLGDRLYKTGDLARYLPDGNIECLGRIDNQVKIRGFRIELGEIEAVLNLHPAVRESVVVGRVDLSGDKHLVAYIVASSPDFANQKQTLTTSELRSFLKEQLPEYMVPSAFVFLEALPLTPNGKVDRRALPMPELSRPELEKNFVAPQDPLELQLTKIWEEVLGIQPIGIRDNFFELGGHSLVAVRLFSEISKAFGKNLPLTTLFQSPTIEQLANILRSSGCDAPIKSLVPLKLGGDKPPLFCIYGILLYHDLASNLDSQQPVYGVYLQEEVDLLQAGRLEDLSALTSVTDLARRYLKEIQTLQPEGPYFLTGLSFGGLVAFEMAQQLHMQGEKVALLALFDTPGPADRKKLPWQERVSLHLRNLLQQGSSYALKKAKRRISSSKKRLVSIMSTISRKFDPRSGHILPSYPQQVAELDVRQQVRDRAFRNYVPRPYPGKVIVFRAMDREQFEAYDTDPQFGWGELAAGGLEVYDVPGDHIGILKEPHVQVLAERLRECLEQVQIDG